MVPRVVPHRLSTCVLGLGWRKVEICKVEILRLSPPTFSLVEIGVLVLWVELG